MFRHLGKRNTAGIVAVLVAVVAGASAYAYTASVGVFGHNAGAGSAVVSGYTVSGPTNYTFSADGTTVVGVDFDLDAAATDVAAALSAAAPVHNDWVDCGASSGVTNSVSCTFSTPGRERERPPAVGRGRQHRHRHDRPVKRSASQGAAGPAGRSFLSPHMRISLTPKQMVSGASTLGTLATAWVLLAPTALGGEATYVVTDGISMQPRFHAGDLAIVRAESGYHVGEIVAYRSRLLHTIILHRIIGTEGDRYIFKGDNNDFVDLEHPTRSQLVGRLWLHVPGLGSHLGPLRRPGSVALAVMFGLLLFLSSLFTKKQLRRKRLRAARAPTFRLRLPTRAPSGPVVGFGVAVALAGLLTVVAFTKPSRAPAPFAVPYTQSGTFAYSATTTPGAAYPDGRVTTGDPLFLRLVRSADVGFSYRFAQLCTPSRRRHDRPRRDARIVDRMDADLHAREAATVQRKPRERARHDRPQQLRRAGRAPRDDDAGS